VQTSIDQIDFNITCWRETYHSDYVMRQATRRPQSMGQGGVLHPLSPRRGQKEEFGTALGSRRKACCTFFLFEATKEHNCPMVIGV